MAYAPRFKFSFNSDNNELVEVWFDAKDGVGAVYSGRTYFIMVTNNQFRLGTTVTIDAIQIGNKISFDGDIFTITGFTFDFGIYYTIDIAEGGLLSHASEDKDYTIGPEGSPSGALIEFEDLNSNGVNAGAAFITCKINKSSDNSKHTDPIIWSELDMTLHLPKNNTTVNFETFLTSNHDDWMVRMYNDGQAVFHGFLVPDEGSIALQDKPYEVNFKAVDGLKLLSGISIKQQNGTEFNAKHNLSELVAAALFYTGLNLPIRIYSNFYHSGMVTRADNINYDMFQQANLDYRTFMTSATGFTNCYEALQIILGDLFQLSYSNGMWVITCLPEYQYLASSKYYTDYDAAGSIVGGVIDTSDFGKIGRTNIIRAINENQYKSARFAYKSVKHSFKYTIWDEIPRNNKFERATLDPTAPNTSTEKYYTLENWTYGRENSPVGLPLPAAITTAKAWRKSTLNAFNVEIDRELQLQASADGPYAKMFRSESIPVSVNDKIQLSFQIRLTNSLSTPGNYLAARVYIITGGTKYFLQDPPSTGKPAPWVTTFAAIDAIYTSGDNTSEYLQIDVTSESIPANGELFIHFRAEPIAGANIYIKDFQLTYTPYIAGGYLPVKGDYWTRSQTKSFPDTYENEVKISDSPVGAAKGTIWLLTTGGYIKTTTDWYRLGVTEHRHFKELLNIGFYNHTYRRFPKFDGDWDGTKYVDNATSAQMPVSFVPLYKFEDLGNELYMLCCPVTIDYIKGRFTGTFQQVKATIADGTQIGDSADFKYLFE